MFIAGTALLAFLFALVPAAVEDGWSAYRNRFGDATIQQDSKQPTGGALEALQALEVKGRASKQGYSREQFGDGWASQNGCSTRSIILYRDLSSAVVNDACVVVSGVLADPYTGESIAYSSSNGQAVQIDHVVALSDAWQKGAQYLSLDVRKQLANDPLELLAVDGAANNAKGDGDAATWLPKNKAFRCPYIARQIAVKQKYRLWVTEAEQMAMQTVLNTCPLEPLPER